MDTRVYAEDLKEQKMSVKREQLKEGKIVRVMELEDKMGPVVGCSITFLFGNLSPIATDGLTAP